jgi:hypothetical protein
MIWAISEIMQYKMFRATGDIKVPERPARQFLGNPVIFLGFFPEN